MIHDLDLLLDLAGSPLAEVRAVGRAVVTPFPDFAVAQLRFENGASAHDHRQPGERRPGTAPPAPRPGRGDPRGLPGAQPRSAPPRRRRARPRHADGWGTDRTTWTEHDSLDAEHAAFIAAITEGAPVEADGPTGLRALDAALRVEAAIAETR